MKTQEQTAVQWLQQVIKWLNKDDNYKSKLSDPSILLLKKLETVQKRNELKTALDIIEDLKLLIEKCDTTEGTEIRLKCGLIAAELGLFSEALNLSGAASTKYAQGHNYGVAQWMVGCIQWLLPGKEIDAISSWRNSIKSFELLCKANQGKKDDYIWYTERCKEMIRALHLGTKRYGIPPLPPYDETSEEDSDDEVQESPTARSQDYLEPEMDCLSLFPAYEQINAGDFGPSGILSESTGDLEVDRVFINSRPHRILSINGDNVTRLSSTSKSIVIKVSGDSMNKAKILNGDYVLLRLLPKDFSNFDLTGMYPEDYGYYLDADHSQIVKDGDIVAAEVVDEDSEITLKRIFRRGRKIILAPDSTNAKYQIREFDGMNKNFSVCGVVTAVFKPL